ncbi:MULTISPECIES: amidohydrolase family protein [Streptomyces]|uniref:amidohydrolase family protein n=1 Tax=Streptomyces TaxID=1883 RepID=UPI002277249C|nr:MULTISPECIES: amidohydrolase family protein [Streptomyces]
MGASREHASARTTPTCSRPSARRRGPLRGVAVIDPGRRGEELDRPVETGACGIRLNLISGPVPPLEDRLWQRLVHELAALGLYLEVQAQQRQWEELEPWLLGWPGAVVVDHRGLPAALSLSYPGSAALSRLLAGQHVWAKAAVPCRANGRAYSTPTWLTAELNPTEALRILCANPARLFAWTPFRRAADDDVQGRTQARLSRGPPSTARAGER